MLQTMKPRKILGTDISIERLKRVGYVLDMYAKTFKEIRETVELSRMDANELSLSVPGCFDKVLCDVPCFTDRTVIHNDESNIFASSRNLERINLPKVQADLLT